MSLSARHTQNPYRSFHDPTEAISHLIFNSLVPPWAFGVRHPLSGTPPPTPLRVSAQIPLPQGTSAWPPPHPWKEHVMGALVASSVNYVCGPPGCPTEAEAESGPRKVLHQALQSGSPSSAGPSPGPPHSRVGLRTQRPVGWGGPCQRPQAETFEDILLLVSEELSGGTEEE